jgi:hypothetical protein
MRSAAALRRLRLSVYTFGAPSLAAHNVPTYPYRPVVLVGFSVSGALQSLSTLIWSALFEEGSMHLALFMTF